MYKGVVSTYGIKNNTLYYYNSLNEIVSVDLENGEKRQSAIWIWH